MTGKEKIIHRVTVNSAQPMVVPRRGTFALRRSRLIRRRFRQGFYTVGFLLSLGAISQAGYGFFMETPYFEIKPVQIDGVSEPLRKEISGLVKSFSEGKHNLFTIDSKELEKQIGQHPRVRDIQVEKVYPDQLLITAVEREEVAVATTDNGFFLIDNDGHVMDALDSSDDRITQYPFISGLRTEEVHEGEPVNSASLKNALNMLQVLEARNAPLYARISQVEIRGDDVSPLETLVVHMDSGLEVKFGDSNPIEKLPALETLLQKFESEDVDAFTDLVYIDLRFNDMAFCMDRKTAWDIARNKYDDVQRMMEEENEKYRKKNPEEPYKWRGSQGERKVAGEQKSDSVKQSSANAGAGQARSRTMAQRSAQPAQRQAQNYGAYQNYRQPAQQYYPPQYTQQQYQQYQYQQTQQQQPASMYNLPANQPRY